MLLGLCLIKKRNGWSALNSSNSEECWMSSVSSADPASSVPSSVTSRYASWMASDILRLSAEEMPERLAEGLNRSVIPKDVKTDVRLYFFPIFMRGRYTFTLFFSITLELVHSVSFSKLILFSSCKERQGIKCLGCKSNFFVPFISIKAMIKVKTQSEWFLKRFLLASFLQFINCLSSTACHCPFIQFFTNLIDRKSVV